jgi:hypothetical protein
MKFKLIEELVLEAKADEMKFREWAKDDKLADLFISLKKNFKSPYNDFYYWMKRDVDELKDYIEENKPKSDKIKSEEE